MSNYPPGVTGNEDYFWGREPNIWGCPECGAEGKGDGEKVVVSYTVDFDELDLPHDIPEKYQRETDDTYHVGVDTCPKCGHGFRAEHRNHPRVVSMDEWEQNDLDSGYDDLIRDDMEEWIEAIRRVLGVLDDRGRDWEGMLPRDSDDHPQDRVKRAGKTVSLAKRLVRYGEPDVGFTIKHGAETQPEWILGILDDMEEDD